MHYAENTAPTSAGASKFIVERLPFDVVLQVRPSPGSSARTTATTTTTILVIVDTESDCDLGPGLCVTVCGYCHTETRVPGLQQQWKC